jgi:hypothetical protein
VDAYRAHLILVVLVMFAWSKTKCLGLFVCVMRCVDVLCLAGKSHDVFGRDKFMMLIDLVREAAHKAE